jgi:hypothetical protein
MFAAVETGNFDCPTYRLTRMIDGLWNAFIKTYDHDLGSFPTWQAAWKAVQEWYDRGKTPLFST